jgi:hypothetical protein
MREENSVDQNKARRVMETSNALRRWLQRGMRDEQPGLGTTMMRSFGLTTTSDVGEEHALIKQVWARIKKSHEVRNRTTFPDFLTAGDFQILAAILGTRLTADEARALTLMAAPDKAGKVPLSSCCRYNSQSSASRCNTPPNTGTFSFFIPFFCLIS